jgi:hypothetical protein
VTDRWGVEETVESSLWLRLWLADDLYRLAAEGGFALRAVYADDLRPLPPTSDLSGELGNLYFVFVSGA